MSHTKNKSDTPRFQVGDKVRVKYGVIDPDFSRHPSGRLVRDCHGGRAGRRPDHLRNQVEQENPEWDASGLPQEVRAGRIRNGIDVAG